MDILAIDVGSNSIKCLLAKKSGKNTVDVKFEETIHKRISAEDGLVDDAADIISESFESFLDKAKLYSEDFSVRAAGTSALRSSAAFDAISEVILKKTGVKIELFSGDREAITSFFGAMTEPMLPDFKRVNYIDLGGGSLEEVYASKTSAGHFDIISKSSISIGAYRLSQIFESTNSILSAETIQEMSDYCKSRLIQKHDFNISDVVVGSGGAISAARYMLNMEYKDTNLITLADFERFLNTVASMTTLERVKRYNIPFTRADILPAGFICTIEFLKFLKMDKLHHTYRNLRYGLVLDI